jgi:hypothetical protein
MIRELADKAGTLFALGVDSGNEEAIETALGVLELNDEEER